MERNYPEIRFGSHLDRNDSLYLFPGISTAAAVVLDLTEGDEAALLSLLLRRSSHAGPSADREETPMARVIDNSADAGDQRSGGGFIDLSRLKPSRDWDTQTFLANRRAAGRRIADMNGGRTRGSRRSRSRNDDDDD